MNNTLELLEKELRRWPGVRYRVDTSGRHPRLRVQYGEVERFVPYSFTKVGNYGLMQKLTQLRRTLKEIGAEHGKRTT
jgi:hypothetical protein